MQTNVHWFPDDPAPYTVSVIETFELYDAERDKNLPIKITFPNEEGRYPVIIFSHGALGSKDNYRPLIDHWAGHGYVCIQPTHEDSRKQMNLIQLLNKNNIWNKWSTRPPDIRLIMDSLALIESKIPALSGKPDHTRIGVGGHSFGAHTAQLLAGARLHNPATGNLISFADERPRAFLMISPQGTGEALKKDSWQTMTRPVMIITGSNDTSSRTGRSADWRMEPWRFAPPGDKYLVFIEGAWHGFGGIAGKVRFPGSGPANPDHVDTVRTSSLVFWDTYLKGNSSAMAYLTSGALERGSNTKVSITFK